jgi:hypothetical protein
MVFHPFDPKSLSPYFIKGRFTPHPFVQIELRNSRSIPASISGHLPPDFFLCNFPAVERS